MLPSRDFKTDPAMEPMFHCYGPSGTARHAVHAAFFVPHCRTL